MTRDGVEEYIKAIRARYWAAGKQEKGRILDEACKTTGFHRKAIIRQLRGTRVRVTAKPRTPQYGVELLEPLVLAWEVLGRPCAVRLHAALPQILPALQRHHELPAADERCVRLLQASASTIQRLLKKHHRGSLLRHPQTSSRAQPHLRDEVALRTFSEWVHPEPGMLQADLVAHCGESTRGHYLCSLQMVSVAVGWTILEAVWGKGQQRVGTAIHHGRMRLPFALTGWHTDNGGEFISYQLQAWCRRESIALTRGRPYRKNDQAWAEQRNWTAVRRMVGYGRYTTREAHAKLKELYVLIELDLNLFQPVQKLLGKTRTGAHVTRRYGPPLTPLQRGIATGAIDESTAVRLQRQVDAINPVDLRRRIDTALGELWNLADPPLPSVTLVVTQPVTVGNPPR